LAAALTVPETELYRRRQPPQTPHHHVRRTASEKSRSRIKARNR
jgi:hypothetical protein